MTEEPESVGRQVGACGVSCGFCQVSKHEDYKCLGCNWANRMLRESRETRRGCVFWECAQRKEVDCCFTCSDFPCQTHYSTKEAVYTTQILDSWEELKRTGLTFWGRRKELESSIEAEDKEDGK